MVGVAPLGVDSAGRGTVDSARRQALALSGPHHSDEGDYAGGDEAASDADDPRVRRDPRQ